MSRVTPTQEQIMRIVADSPIPLNRMDIGEQIARTHRTFVNRSKGTTRLTFVQSYVHMKVLFDHLHVLTVRGELIAIKGSDINGDYGWLHSQGVYFFTKDTLAAFQGEQSKVEDAVRRARAHARAVAEISARYEDEVEELTQKFMQEEQ